MRIRPNSLGFTLLLGALAALPPLAIDISLPALSAISASLHAPPAATGLTLSLFMAGFAIAQLVFGPLSVGVASRLRESLRTTTNSLNRLRGIFTH